MLQRKLKLRLTPKQRLKHRQYWLHRTKQQPQLPNKQRQRRRLIKRQQIKPQQPKKLQTIRRQALLQQLLPLL